MKMVMAILSESDAPAVAAALTKEGYPSTVTSSYGGFLHKKNAILFSGVDDTKVRYVISIIGSNSSPHDEQAQEPENGSYMMPPQIKVGGASVFVFNIEQFIHI